MRELENFFTKARFLLFFCLSLFVVTTQAQFVVDRTDDSAATTADNCTAAANDCSLRGAIMLANTTGADETITFDPTVFAGTVTISLNIATGGGDGGADEGDLDITDSLTITGTGARTLIIDQTTTDRIFDISAGDTVSITGLTILGGAEDGDGSDGGGIRNQGTVTLFFTRVTGNTVTDTNGNGGGIANLAGTLTIVSSLIDANTASGNNSDGGGIYNDSTVANSTVTIANSTITNNSTTGSANDGGGIWNDDPNNTATLNLNNVTISHNGVPTGRTGGGIFDGDTVNLRNNIIALNTINGATNVTGADIDGSITSQGDNIIGNGDGASGFDGAGANADTVGNNTTQINPVLGSLSNNGGATDTRTTGPTSPAVNNVAVGDNDCISTATCGTNNPPVMILSDQRGTGFVRSVGLAIDSGAFELLTPSAAAVSIGGRVTNASGRGLSGVTVMLAGGTYIEPVYARTSPFGYYSFNGITAGQAYIITVTSKTYTFNPSSQVIEVLDSVTGADFISQE